MNLKMKWEELFYWCCVCFTVFAIISTIAEPYSPLYFVSEGAKDRYYGILLIGGPLSIFLAKMTHFLNHKRPGSLLLHFMAACFLSISLFLSIIIIEVSNAESWTNKEAVYRHRFEEDKVVVTQYRSWHGSRLAMSRPFTKHFKLVTPIDSAEINDYEWERVMADDIDQPQIMDK